MHLPVLSMVEQGEFDQDSNNSSAQNQNYTTNFDNSFSNLEFRTQTGCDRAEMNSVI